MDGEMQVRRFLKSLELKRYSGRSVSTYRYPLMRLLRHLESHGGRRLKNVTPDLMVGYRLSLVDAGFSSESVVTYISAAKRFFAFLEETGVVFRSPVAGMRNPRCRKRIADVPSEKDIAMLLDSVSGKSPASLRDRAMIETAYGCGLRLAETVGLDVKCADLEDGTLRVFGKGSAERMLPLGKRAMEAIGKYLEDGRPRLEMPGAGGALWLGTGGKRMSAQVWQKTLHSRCVAAGLGGKITCHSLRRACATHMLRNGAGPVEIQHMLGHADLKTLGHYLNLTLNDLRKTHSESAVGK